MVSSEQLALDGLFPVCDQCGTHAGHKLSCSAGGKIIVREGNYRGIESIYLAAQYSRRDELRDYAKRLADVGIRVTSEWLNESEALTSDMGDHPVEFYARTAALDILNVLEADAFVFFSEDPLIGIKRGGRHVEFGFALATGKPLFVVGPKENIFHYLDSVQHFKTVDELIDHVAVTAHA